MKQIEQTYTIQAPLAKVWQALVDPHTIDAWGGGLAKMSAKEGAAFSLWNGDIHGTNTKVVPEQLLEQDWFGGDWPEPSKVVFSLKAVKDHTTVRLTHIHLPEEEVDDFASGWKEYYLGAMKAFLEQPYP